MFGTSNNNSGGGLFGSGGTSNNSSGGLFGSKPTFGSKPENTSSGFSFGANNGASNPPAQGGSLFGQSNNAASSGTSNTGGGLFGQNQNQPASGGGLFGNANQTSGFGNQASSNTGTTGGLFGAKAPSANTGSTFGASGNQNNSSFGGNTAGGLFGNKPSGGGLFGNASATGPSTNTGGLFGSSASNPATNTGTGNAGGSLFGSNTNTANPGTNTGGGLFGSSNNQAGSSIGNTAINTSSQPSFGWNSQTSNQAQNPNQTQNVSQNLFSTQNKATLVPSGGLSAISNDTKDNNYTPAVIDQIIKVKEQWDPDSPKCVLKTHLYNKINDQESSMLNQQRPLNESPEDWDNAMSKRPGPSYYPVKITSFTDIAQRIEVQLDHVAKSRILLNGINDKQSSLSSKHDLDNTTRIMKAKSKHVILSRRLLRLATVLAILKLKGYPLLPEEEEISKQFELLNQKIEDPSGALGKLNDVFARLAILKERSEDLASQFDTSLNSVNGLNKNHDDLDHSITIGDDNSNSVEIIQKLSKLLHKQQIGLNRLNEVLEKDTETVNKLISQN
ncbi:Piso0_004216 [Millerozyma farinosa CBS 7064]|uniref:Piso0_004216 protein n=1 Tax=Pichia sorbitophila (strain ATCC MYA-4447 / BCRC 22081 / CBS 7064 / NBRC 10061 / NRRL Y-12695) TaxID=559304 RepID=G8YAP9_PICSO|nr:Piso0_004216 [Millerozyma farinosa CBS 7064]CCE84663.1 Piso0_004216 [Millerozyma farinosa CBS 7064]